MGADPGCGGSDGRVCRVSDGSVCRESGGLICGGWFCCGVGLSGVTISNFFRDCFREEARRVGELGIEEY